MQTERDGLSEDIRLDGLALHLAFQEKDLTSSRVHQNHLVVLAIVEMSVNTYKTVIQVIEILSKRNILRLVFRFIIIEGVISVSQIYVAQHLLPFLGREVYGLKQAVVLHITDKRTYLKVRGKQRTLFEVFVP